jgi:hypothetical protein
MYAFLIYFILFTFIFRGRTIGKIIVGIKIVDTNGGKAKINQILIRYTVKFFLYFEIFYATLGLNTLENIGVWGNIIILVLYFFLVIIYCKSIVNTINKKEPLVYESLSHTKHVSTIKNKNKKVENNDKPKIEKEIKKEEEKATEE